MKRSYFCLISILILSCILLCGCSDDANGDYQSTLFDTGSVHKIDITLSDEDWDDLLDNPTDKTKYKADIVIDGEELKDVAFATKGNSSLYFVADDPKSDRYSFKVTFGKYVDGQTYHGLDKLSLNNNFCDATYMKDYFCYELFRKAGVPAPLTSYVWLRVNGRDRGLYLAVEDEENSFLDRAYDGEGVIYKPESKSVGLTSEDIKNIKENGLSMPKDPRGTDLVYTYDDPESYPDIFENAETDADETNAREVISALKDLSEEKKLENCLDTKEIISFFAAHNFVLNYDSYTGAMLHNLVLHDNNGKLSLIPWDYNLAFCTFVPGTGREVLKDVTNRINQGIDTPLISASEDRRPMWKWIADDEKYLAEYHDALDSLVSDYFESGEFDSRFNELYEMLLPYVEKDPTAFYSADEYTKGCETMRQFCNLRAESIRKQLDGDLPAVSGDQPDRDKVDASDIDITDMGAFVYAAGN